MLEIQKFGPSDFNLKEDAVDLKNIVGEHRGAFQKNKVFDTVDKVVFFKVSQNIVQMWGAK